MAFGMSPFPFQFGTRGGGGASGDPTALTQALLEAWGFVYLRSGGQLAKNIDGDFVSIAANEIATKPINVSGQEYLALLMQRSGTPLASYSADMSNAAWTKSNVTPVYSASGGLADGGHTVLTATSNNAWCGRVITSSSAPRRSRAIVEAGVGNVGDVFVSHGRPTGSPLYSDNFSSDTSGEWSRAFNSVNGTIVVSGGALTYTVGAGDGGSNIRISRPITGFVVGKRYMVPAVLGGSGTTRLDICTDAAGLAAISTLFTTGHINFMATATTLYAVLRAQTGGGGTTATLDDVSVYEVEEHIVTPGIRQEIDLTEFTGANNLLNIRLTTSGDTADVFDFQAGTPGAGVPMLRWSLQQGASPAAVGASSCLLEIDSPPALVDMTFLVETPEVNASATFVLATLYESASTNNRMQVYFANGSYYLRKNTSTDVEIVGGKTAGDIVRLDVLWDAFEIKARADHGSWIPLSFEAIHAFNRMALGHDHTPANHFNAGIIAMADNGGTVFDG